MKAVVNIINSLIVGFFLAGSPDDSHWTHPWFKEIPDNLWSEVSSQGTLKHQKLPPSQTLLGPQWAEGYDTP